ncbi:hypothetical protein GQX74_014913 [Glossina fuscipes]|nr:hypothetical protein GQX74_014913 [Glossina fuscipes]
MYKGRKAFDIKPIVKKLSAEIEELVTIFRIFIFITLVHTVEKFRCTATSRILFSSIAPSELKTSKLTIEPCRWSFVCRLRSNVTADARVHKDSKLLCHWLISILLTNVTFVDSYNSEN